MKTDTHNRFSTGALAYYDTFSGLIPCKVISIVDALESHPKLAGASSACRITVKLTAPRGAFKRGEEITTDALKIIPRSHVFLSSGQYRIRGGYRWMAPEVHNQEMYGDELSHDLTAFDMGADF